ncbi:hypothetical protein TNCT_419101 [Trichonephila clavata]|uniref:Uncharacterized protein n=1 Tax=Trichonephila clavata TaxID=2740835 RepID=A0A8X6KTK7_TRICU|nr:hypothetical protein TNCT_419101 [Trichonephila clavata]
MWILSLAPLNHEALNDKRHQADDRILKIVSFSNGVEKTGEGAGCEDLRQPGVRNRNPFTLIRFGNLVPKTSKSVDAELSLDAPYFGVLTAKEIVV